jgi:hypothetical protein
MKTYNNSIQRTALILHVIQRRERFPSSDSH